MPLTKVPTKMISEAPAFRAVPGSNGETLSVGVKADGQMTLAAVQLADPVRLAKQMFGEAVGMPV